MSRRGWGLVFVAVLAGALAAPTSLRAQGGQRVTKIERGTEIVVRTNQYIESDRRDNRVYTGTVDQDVRGLDGRLAISRGSQVEMIVRTAPDNDLILDLESVTIRGERYPGHRYGADRITQE